jgi:hypothetical protein
VVNKYLRKYSISLAIRELQINSTLRFYVTQSEWLSSRKQTTTNAGDDIRGQVLLYTVEGKVY